MGISAVMVIALALGAGPLVLDNGAVRVEIAPETQCVRFAGFASGQNFVEPVLVAEDRETTPGGLQAHVIGPGSCPVGPANVVERDDRHVLLRGPKADNGLFAEQEITLLEKEDQVRFKVRLKAEKPVLGPFAWRVIMRARPDSTFRVRREGGVKMRAIAGARELRPYVVPSVRYWLMPVPPTERAKDILLGAFTPVMQTERESGFWTRRIMLMPDSAGLVPQESTFLCLLDSASHSYGAALQSPWQNVSPTEPLVYTEEWTFERRGPK